MSKIYKIDQNNFITYDIIDDFIIAKFIFFDKIENLRECIKKYIDYFITLDINFLGCYPGTCNPLIINYAAEVLSDYGFKYKFFYDDEEVKNNKNFINKTLKFYTEKILSKDNQNIPQPACDGYIGKSALTEGFKQCCIFGQLNNKTENVKTPVKYYRINSEGFLCEEFIEKPENDEYYYKSIRISNMFKSYKILLENGSLKYFPKD